MSTVTAPARLTIKGIPGVSEPSADYVRDDLVQILVDALRAMQKPPLILATDDATQVASWYDFHIRAALAAYDAATTGGTDA